MNKCNPDACNKSERRCLHSLSPPRSPPASPRQASPLSPGRGSLARPSSGSECRGWGAEEAGCGSLAGDCKRPKGPGPWWRWRVSPWLAHRTARLYVLGARNVLRFIYPFPSRWPLGGLQVSAGSAPGRGAAGASLSTDKTGGSGSLWCLSCLPLIFRPNIFPIGYSTCEEAYKVLC